MENLKIIINNMENEIKNMLKFINELKNEIIILETNLTSKNCENEKIILGTTSNNIENNKLKKLIKENEIVVCNLNSEIYELKNTLITEGDT